ncbi:adenosylmethionine decarboxylase [Halioxenophilus sp. WMMB6]|uniref:adenosylmethionine decarboxylase n=1 Tax=Halioxenophilus sp. WMMB6 TaxID=3073815 RepID=UPI00295E9000|nr:adenosylmethionine decarboxylase [Halioxenophilus sp. WMMB6]
MRSAVDALVPTAFGGSSCGNEPVVSDQVTQIITASDDKDHFITRDGVTFAGSHLIIDLWGAKYLDDMQRMENAMRRCVEVCGATLLHIHLHHFAPDGISGVAVLAESHISVHTWPEREYAAFDVFMCGDAKPELAIIELKRAFFPSRIEVNEQLRGVIRD